LALTTATVHVQKVPERWPEDKANTWYAQQPWLVGANFVPSDAINQLEMFRRQLSIQP